MSTLKEDLDVNVAELRQLVSRCSTVSVTGWCFSYVVMGQNQKREIDLHSPDRQVAFLLGIMLSSPEPDAPTDWTADIWKRVIGLLNEISGTYMQLYFPHEDERNKLTRDWWRIREVAMLTFMHYFNTGLLASVEQIKDRLGHDIRPFDEELQSLIGIRSADAADICHFLASRLQYDLDEFQRLAFEVGEELDANPALANTEPTSLGPPVMDPTFVGKAVSFIERLRGLGLVKLVDIEANFPDTARAFWATFSVSRGQGQAISYPTEQSLFDVRPLIRIDDGTAFCITANSLFYGVLAASEDRLAHSPSASKFFHARDKSLERQVAQCARALLGKGVTVWEGVCETPDGQNEHDVIAFDDRLCIIFEAKASPPREPLRDPERAFVRIRDAFRSDTGIQKAYNQGNRIVRRILKGEIVPLFDRNGSQVGSISRGSRFALCACVTRDDFGPLATNLQLLLEKTDHDAYPWALNILDLSTLAEAWTYFGWDSTQLRSYLEKRLPIHGRVFAAYELDYAGCFVRHGGFDSLMASGADLVQLGTEYSDVFDDIYRHLHAGGPAVVIDQKEPFMWDVRRSLAAGKVVPVPTSGQYGNVGRNAPCPCGSGKKYKKCHGR
jgi:hypothetical protein